MILSEAQFIAKETLERLRPHTERIDIAGSVRRKKTDVKDIEIVALPLEEGIGLFGDIVIRSQGFTDNVKSLGQIAKGDPHEGRYCCIILPEYAVQVDLFIPQRHDYFRQFAIRTGSAEYARDHIAAAWRKKGWVGTEDGLRLESECYATVHTVFGVSTPKQKWHCTTDTPTLPPVWGSEEEFFDWLGEKWIKPEERV